MEIIICNCTSALHQQWHLALSHNASIISWPIDLLYLFWFLRNNRDLKPNNIGFLKGHVKLFDFGLSRELPQLDVHMPFEMSGKVGTLRYMAVEVAMHRPYNVAADVYSWSMVCYELMTLQKPFGGWTRDMHNNLVCGKGVRPEFTTDINMQLKQLLEQCWAQKAKDRPNMRQVVDRLRIMEEEQLLLCSQAAPTQMPPQSEAGSSSGLGVFMRRGRSRWSHQFMELAYSFCIAGGAFC